ncbi:hypothetical protein [Burkholderia multivorans]|nr:hypothetical protein [Burkholderia multivorans]
MNGMAAYEARKREKQRLRLSRGIPAVEWNVDAIDLAEIRLPPAGR